MTHERNITPEFIDRLGIHAESLKQNYFMIYFENSLKKRNLFFGEPLIQHLWSLYRAECSDQFCAYLQEVSL